MKVIIIDDEIHIKEAIDIMVDWEKYGIKQLFYAANGKAGLEIIEREQPDILFCDMEMPVMGGEQLLQEIVHREIKIQIIAISGYDNFTYIHATLLARGIDYLLKPFSQERVINALEQAIFRIEGLRKENAKLKQHEQMGVTMAAQVLQRLCSGKVIGPEQVQEAFSKLGAEKKEFMTVAILNRNANRLLEEQYEGDRDIFFFSVSNIVREVFKTYKFCREIFIDDFYWQLFLQDDHLNSLKIIEKMKQLEEIMNTKMGLQMTYIVNSLGTECSDIENEVMEQTRLLQNRGVWGCKLLASENFKEEIKIPSVQGMELGIMSAMKKRNSNALDDLIAEYCHNLKNNQQMKLRNLMNCTNDINWLLQRIISQNINSSQLIFEPLSIWINDIEVWEYEVRKRMHILMDHYLEVKTPAEKIYEYIQENYMKEITLSTIAKDFHQTPQNIAKLFKNQYHMTVVNFILKIRMERACELLKKEDWNITQIGEMTGYEDANYFCRVFRKYFGITPMQYRKKSRI